MSTLTDEQIIDRLRCGQRYRRPIGVTFILIGLIGAALLFHFVNDMRNRSLAMFAEFQTSAIPTTQQAKQSFDASQFYLGFALGSSFIAGVAFSCIFALTGMIFLLPNRKDQMLLQYWSNLRAAPGSLIPENS